MAMEEESVVIKVSTVGAEKVVKANKEIGDSAKAAKAQAAALKQELKLSGANVWAKEWGKEWQSQIAARKAEMTASIRATQREELAWIKGWGKEWNSQIRQREAAQRSSDARIRQQQRSEMARARADQKKWDAEQAILRSRMVVGGPAKTFVRDSSLTTFGKSGTTFRSKQALIDATPELQASALAAGSVGKAAQKELAQATKTQAQLDAEWGAQLTAQAKERDRAKLASQKEYEEQSKRSAAEYRKQMLMADREYNAAQKRAASTWRAEEKAKERAARTPAGGGRGGAGRSAGLNFGFAGTLVNAFLGVTLVKGIAELADEFLTLRNRLKLVTDSTDQANGVFKETVRIANESRTSLAAVGQLYQRLATSVQGLPITNRQLLEVTESISKAATIGGSNALETEKGLFQLTQGLARGQLRGDELRSILEQLPGVADVIAKKFGVARGELSKLGAEGKITSRIIVEAFLEQKKSIEDAFEKTVPTLSGAFQIAKNNVIVFFGEMEGRSGILTTVAKGILLIGTNIELIARVAIAGALVKAINLAKAAFISLTTVAGLTPGGILVKGLTLLVGLTVAFGDKLKIVGSQATLLDVIAVIFERIESALKSIYNLLPSVSGEMAKMPGYGANSPLGPPQSGFGFGSIPIIGGLFGGVVDEASRRNVNNTFEENYRVNKQGKLFPNYLDQLSRGAAGKAGEAGNATGGNRKGFADYLNDARQELSVLQEQGRAQNILRDIEKVRKALRGNMSDTQEKELRSVLTLIQKQREVNEIIKMNEDTMRAIRLAGAEGDQRSVLEAKYAFADAAKIQVGQITPEDSKNIERLTLMRVETERYYEMLRQINGEHDQYKQDLETLADLYDANRISLAQYNAEVLKRERDELAKNGDFRSGLLVGLYDIQLESLNLGAMAGNTIADGFNKAGDALTEFVMTGKNGFKDLADSIIRELARIAIQKMIVAPLAGAFSTLLGGSNITAGGGGQDYSSMFNTSSFDTTQMTLGATPRASGGPLDARQLALVGENGPELFSPRTAGTVINTAQTRQLLNNMGRGNVTVAPPAKVTITHINNAPGVKTETKQSKGPDGTDVIEMITSAVDSKQMQNAQRGVGAMPAILQQHGIRSQGMHR